MLWHVVTFLARLNAPNVQVQTPGRKSMTAVI
jgi:hypothetical protein